jgi:hypothetical protein
MPLLQDLLLTTSEYRANGFSCSEPRADVESRDYGAHTFEVNGHRAVFRVARTTPAKAGQFVTLWQRTAQGTGPIRPFDSSDGIGFFVVSVRGEAGFGQFVFPQGVLITRGVVSADFVGGKRAVRVYPPWSEPASRTAQATQRWQLEHFYPIPDPAGALQKLLGRPPASLPA